MARIELSTVTLCAVTSVNLEATIQALRASIDQIRFGESLLLTDAPIGPPHPEIRVVPIAPLRTGADYSDFMLHKLADHIGTPHCLVVQWDGFVLDAERWDPRFLDCDYIGAPWPQFADGHDVGNGGFSLRSRKLLDACRDPRFQPGHPEDLAIGRTNRPLLEREHGIRFADAALAGRFAFERLPPRQPAFGFHGIFNMIPALGAERFWEIYRSLDDRRTAFTDFALLMRQLRQGDHALRRQMRLSIDGLRYFIGG